MPLIRSQECRTLRTIQGHPTGGWNVQSRLGRNANCHTVDGDKNGARRSRNGTGPQWLVPLIALA